jgi:dUTP pyrophosphatase
LKPKIRCFLYFFQKQIKKITFAAGKKYIMLVKIVNKSSNPLPKYETMGSAGMDIRAFMDAPIELQPLERAMIPTGLFLELPQGYEAQIRPRSGLAAKKGLSIPNSPGTIDSDYRGEIKIIIINLSNEVQIIEPTERVAQMVIARYEQVAWNQVEVLGDTERGAGGFGSTGVG